MNLGFNFLLRILNCNWLLYDFFEYFPFKVITFEQTFNKLQAIEAWRDEYLIFLIRFSLDIKVLVIYSVQDIFIESLYVVGLAVDISKNKSSAKEEAMLSQMTLDEVYILF